MIAKAQPSQYTPMTAAGYQMKRLKVDSTMHLPSFCGIPNLKNSTAKDGAVAIDTCNNTLYIWTNADGWTAIVGGTVVDTAAINAAIALRVKYSDTALMLQPYLKKQDTVNRFVANVTKVNDSTIRVFRGNTITDLKILGKPTDTTSLSNRINLKLNSADTISLSNRINLKLSKSDSTIFYTKYRSDTSRTNIYSAINQRLKITDTTNKFVNNVTKKNDSTIIVFKGSTATEILLPRGTGGGGSGTVTSVGTGYGLSGGPITTTGTFLVDSATLSTKYLRRNDTANLVATKSNVALKLNITDTSNRWVNNVTNVNDSTIRVFKGSTSTDLKILGKPTDTTSLSNRINLKLNSADTVSLSNRINLKLNIADTTNKWVNSVTSLNDSTITVFKGSTSTTIELNGRLNGLGTTNYLPMWSSATTLTNSTINDSANNIYFKREGTNRSWLRPTGAQFWQLNDGISESGLIGYGTPNSHPGISMFNSSLTGRSDIRHQTNGGFSFASHAAGTIPLVDQIYFNPTGNLQINQAADSGYKLLVNGDVKITDSVKLTGINIMTDTTTAKPLVIDENGQVKKSTYWPSGVGGTSNGVNGLNGTTNIGLGGTLTDNTVIDATTSENEGLYFGFNTALGQFYAASYNVEFQATEGDIILGLSSNTAVESDLKISNLDAVTDTIAFKPLVFDSSNNIVKRMRSWPSTGGTTTTATRLITAVWNNTGATIPKGSVVYINGAHSSVLPTIALAKANAESTSAYTYGLVETDITNNSQGTVIQTGSITNLNLPTSTYTDGQQLYLSPTVAGGYTLTKPTAPNHYVAIGTITRAHPTFGTIQIAIRNGFQLDEMSDVAIAAVPNDSTLLQFSRVDSLWHDVSVANVMTKYQKIDTSTYYLTSDFTTSSTTAANTNLTFNLGANEVRRIMINGTCSKVGTTGIKLAIGAPTGATIKATQISNLNTINASANSIISAINTLGGTINTVSSTEMPFRIEGIITNGSTAGAVTLQAATVTSGAVTIYAGTLLSVTKVKGL
jgi:hypothetical protein